VRFSTTIKEQIGVPEEAIWKKSKLVVNEQIEWDFEGWFSDSSFSKRRNTKLFKATDITGSLRAPLPRY
jgi:hypothetical protein